MSTLNVFRKRQLLLSVHKILENEMPPVPPSFYQIKQQCYNMRNSRSLMQRNVQTVNYGFNAIQIKMLGFRSFPLISNAFKSHVMSFDFKCHVVLLCNFI